MRIQTYETKRLFWADIIRSFAMISVVAIHTFSLQTLAPATLNIDTLANWLVFIVAKTSVPLFVLLSGALLLGKHESHTIFWKKRLQRILIPWGFWSSVFLVVKFPETLHSIPTALSAFRHIFSAEFTFIPVLFCLYLLIPYFRVIVKTMKPLERWWLIIVWFLGISALPFLRNSMAFPLGTDNGLVRQTINYSGYLLLGYELQMLFEEGKILSILKKITLSLFILATAATLYLHIIDPQQNAYHLLYFAPAVACTSVSLFVLFLFLSHALEKLPVFQKEFQLHKLVTGFSKVSFGIFFIHPLVIFFLEKYMRDFRAPHTVVVNLGLTFVVTLVCFVILLVMKRAPHFKHIA